MSPARREYRIISADSHTLEPPDLWEKWLEKKYLDSAPKLVDDGDGNQVEGFQVHLGGSLGLDSNFGRKLRQHKVTSAELGDYIERVVRNFVKHREGGERFAQWAVRAEEADLR